MYKNGFDINKLQWLMWHKTKPNQTKPNQTLGWLASCDIFFYASLKFSPPYVHFWTNTLGKSVNHLIPQNSLIVILLQRRLCLMIYHPLGNILCLRNPTQPKRLQFIRLSTEQAYGCLTSEEFSLHRLLITCNFEYIKHSISLQYIVLRFIR